MPSLIEPQRVLVFDSGLGGLTVLAELRKLLVDVDIVYVADDKGFPYGAWDDVALIGHIVALIGELIADHAPDLVVIACNTASTLVLPALRAAYSIPFVGTVPAIKPAAEASVSGLVSVLATPGTVTRDYTRQLVETHAGDADVTLIGSSRLAAVAEAWLMGVEIDDTLIASEIAPCFRAAGERRTDIVVLGCTHYPLLIAHFHRLAPWPVTWIDGAAAIARRVEGLLADLPRLAHCNELRLSGAGDTIVFTSGRKLSAELMATLARFGVRA